MLQLGYYSAAQLGGAGYASSASQFDGTNDYMTRGADLTGNANGKLGIFSCWIKPTGGDGTLRTIYRATGDRVFAYLTTGNQFNIELLNASDIAIGRARSASTDFTTANGWRHVVAAWDLANTTINLYVDGSQDETALIMTDDTIDYTATNHGVGATTSGGNKLTGCLSELYFNMAEYLDITSGANLQKFITAGGAPVDLGADGSTPTGTSPLVYFNNDYTAFETNKGTGGDFSVTGALSACADAP